MFFAMLLPDYPSALAYYCLQWHCILALATLLMSVKLVQMIYRWKIHPLRKVPGPWYTSCSSVWLVWQRWNGRLSLEADKLLTTYGPIVRISPYLILVNDPATVEKVFSRRDLDTAPKAIRALRVGGHDWTVTYPENDKARLRRHPVMIATTTKNLRFWHDTFARNIKAMIGRIGNAQGETSEDIVLHLRITTLQNSQVLMGGSEVELATDTFPHVVGQYNFLVVWRLCLPEWLFTWLGSSPFSFARFRVQSSDKLFDLGEDICRQAEHSAKGGLDDDVPNVYKLFTTKSNDEKKFPLWSSWTPAELSAEMAGQILAATETTSSALAFIFYELAKRPDLLQKIFEEMKIEKADDFDNKDLLDACIKEGLRFRPPVALTGSRLAPSEGLDAMGHFLPEGTVLTTQSLSMSRQRPDLFPNCDVFDPERWLDPDAEIVAARKRLLVPFGVGARRCPGFNAALYQMRLILAAAIEAFDISLAPETTPQSMEPFEANGYRSRHDQCFLMFKARDAM